MKKSFFLICFGLFIGTLGTAQELYKLNDSWINLDDFSTKDSTAVADNEFKKKSKYTYRFDVINVLGNIPNKAVYKERPFRLSDDNTVAYKVTENGRDILVQVNKEEQPLDEVPGKVFLFGTPDGVVLVQRFEGNLGYKVSSFDEWGKAHYKQVFPHTRIVEKDGEEYKTPYLGYLTHTPRFMVFTTFESRDINKTIVLDLKDGKMQPLEVKLCGVIRMDNELAYNGYLIRDEKNKNLTVNYQGARWSAKDDNVFKVTAETLVSDSLLVIARHYKGMPDVSLTAFHAKTGKVIWTGDVKQPTGGPQRVVLSKYNNKLLLEGLHPDNNFLEVFDIATGKRQFSSF
jgi:hypothetical protein